MRRPALLSVFAGRRWNRPNRFTCIDIECRYSSARTRIFRIETLVRSVDGLATHRCSPHDAAIAVFPDLSLPQDLSFMIGIQRIYSRFIRSDDDLPSAADVGKNR